MEMSASNIVAPTFGGMPLLSVFAMVLVLSALTACASVYLFRKMTRLDRFGRSTEADILMSGHRAFLFLGEKVVFATSDGRDLLRSMGEETSPWDRIKDYLLSCDPALDEKLHALRIDGTSFRHNTLDRDGVLLEVTGQPRRGFLSLSLRQIEPMESESPAQSGLSAPMASSQDLAKMLDNLPFPIWSRTQEGRVIWANLETHKLCDGEGSVDASDLTLPSAFTLMDEDIGVTQERRVSVGTDDGQNQSKIWYNLFERPLENGDFFGYAIDADDVITVEKTLRRFVATLTESFAQLSTGLAIFNADRRLTIFNPAISDLLQIDPVWLASSPGFRDFMNRARDNHMIPEQKTSADWKKMIQAIEKGAEEGRLSEKWVLPSGQTFKITGRPHPHGAIALMIEDISTRISLERRYRSEIEQSRTTLDYLSEAICVLDTTGALVYANAAFGEIWEFDPKANPETANIVGLTALWGEACKPTPVWGDLREFVTSLDQRASWTSDIELQDGRAFSALFAPLPDGSTLTTFTPRIAEQSDALPQDHRAEVLILELAVDHMKEVVQNLTEKLAQQEDAMALVDEADDPIKDTISYTERLLRLRQNNTPKEEVMFETLSHDLTALLNEKNAGLALTCETIIDEGEPRPEKKRLLFNIMLVVRSLVAPKANVDLSVAEMEEAISLSCMFRGNSDAQNVAEAAGLPYRILVRYVRERGGEVELNRLDDRGLIKISCTIPTPKEETLPTSAKEDISPNQANAS